MNTINIDRLKLIEILKQNKINHVEEYNKALEKWKGQVADQLHKFFDRVAAVGDFLSPDRALQIEYYQGKSKSFSLMNFAQDFCAAEKLESLPKPSNQSAKYDKFIRQLELSVDDVIALSSADYDCYVEDQWDWAVQSKLLNSTYL